MGNSRNRDLREGTKIIFADGEERTVYPLTIRQMRKFNKVVKNLQVDQEDGAANLDDDQITNMIEAVSIVLAKDYPDIAEDRDGLEDLVDMKCFNEVLMSAMGVDPNA